MTSMGQRAFDYLNSLGEEELDALLEEVTTAMGDPVPGMVDSASWVMGGVADYAADFPSIFSGSDYRVGVRYEQGAAAERYRAVDAPWSGSVAARLGLGTASPSPSTTSGLLCADRSFLFVPSDSDFGVAA